MAMLVQNTNPANVAPEQRLVRRGMLREDFFMRRARTVYDPYGQACHVVLPATMFMEHDDIYRGGGQQHIVLGPKLIEGPGETRPNLFVINELATRLGVGDMPGFGLDEKTLIDNMMHSSNLPGFDALKELRWLDVQPDFEMAHYQKGFSWPDGSSALGRTGWERNRPTNRLKSMGPQGPFETLPQWPDYFQAKSSLPMKNTRSVWRHRRHIIFSIQPLPKRRHLVLKERRPELLIHPDDAAELGVGEGYRVEIGNRSRRSHPACAVVLPLTKRGVVISEGIFANSSL